MKTKLPVQVKIIIAVLFTVMVSACANVSYYSQSVIGHSRLMLAREPVDKVLINADDTLARQLVLSKELKRFAIDKLGLPDSKSYNSYVALEREFPVWTVVAAPEFSVDPKQWCYPVIGCASYRGYFKHKSALNYSEKMAADGYETSVGGASAYSTLGWFADPLLPSMMRYGDLNFAETLFHELAHQLIYLNGDSAFNEAFATVVGQQGVIRWLSQFRASELKRYQNQLMATAQFNNLIARYKHHLSELYSSDLNDIQKRSDKQALLIQLEKEYQQLKKLHWADQGWYDSWFSKPLNNARLASFSTYYELVPAFNALLASCDNDLNRFYKTILVLKKQVKTQGTPIEVPAQCWIE